MHLVIVRYKINKYIYIYINFGIKNIIYNIMLRVFIFLLFLYVITASNDTESTEAPIPSYNHELPAYTHAFKTTKQRPESTFNIVQKFHEEIEKLPELEIILDTSTFIEVLMNEIGPLTNDQRYIVSHLFEEKFNNSFTRFNASLTHVEFAREMLIAMYKEPFFALLNNITGEITIVSNNTGNGNGFGYQFKMFNDYFNQTIVSHDLRKTKLHIPMPAIYIPSNVTFQVYSSHLDPLVPNVRFFESTFFFNRSKSLPSDKHRSGGYVIITVSTILLVFYTYFTYLWLRDKWTKNNGSNGVSYTPLWRNSRANTNSKFMLFLFCFVASGEATFTTGDVCNEVIQVSSIMEEKTLSEDGQTVTGNVRFTSDIKLPDINNRICLETTAEGNDPKSTIRTGIKISGIRHIADIEYMYVTYDPELYIKYTDRCQTSVSSGRESDCPSRGCEGSGSCMCFGKHSIKRGVCPDANCGTAFDFGHEGAIGNDARYAKSTNPIKSGDNKYKTDLYKATQNTGDLKNTGNDKFSDKELWLPSYGYCQEDVNNAGFKQSDNECGGGVWQLFDPCAKRRREAVGMVVHPISYNDTNMIFEVYRILGISDTIIDLEVDHTYNSSSPPIREIKHVSIKGTNGNTNVYNNHGIRIRLEDIASVSRYDDNWPAQFLIRHVPDWTNGNDVQSTGKYGIFFTGHASIRNNFVNDYGMIGSIQCPHVFQDKDNKCIAGTGMKDFIKVSDVPTSPSDSIFGSIVKEFYQPNAKAFFTSQYEDYRLPVTMNGGHVVTLKEKDSQIILSKELRNIRYVNLNVLTNSKVSYLTTDVEIEKCGITKIDGCFNCKAGFMITLNAKTRSGLGRAQIINKYPNSDVIIQSRTIEIGNQLKDYVVWGKSSISKSKIGISIQTKNKDGYKSCDIETEVNLHFVDKYDDTIIHSNNTLEEYANGENTGNPFEDIFGSVGNILKDIFGDSFGGILRIVFTILIGLFLFNVFFKCAGKIITKF